MSPRSLAVHFVLLFGAIQVVTQQVVSLSNIRCALFTSVFIHIEIIHFHTQIRPNKCFQIVCCVFQNKFHKITIKISQNQPKNLNSQNTSVISNLYHFDSDLII